MSIDRVCLDSSVPTGCGLASLAEHAALGLTQAGPLPPTVFSRASCPLKGERTCFPNTQT